MSGKSTNPQLTLLTLLKLMRIQDKNEGIDREIYNSFRTLDNFTRGCRRTIAIFPALPATVDRKIIARGIHDTFSSWKAQVIEFGTEILLISMLYIDQLKKLDLNMDKENASLVSIRTEWDELVLSRRDQSRIRKNFGRIISKRAGCN